MPYQIINLYEEMATKTWWSLHWELHIFESIDHVAAHINVY